MKRKKKVKRCAGPGRCPDCHVFMRLINTVSREFQCMRCTDPQCRRPGRARG
jgi:hypothetical protein